MMKQICQRFFIITTLTLVGCGDASTADTIFSDGTIITVDDQNPIAEALAVSDGKIMAVGDASTILNLKGRRTTVVDLDGRTLMPGFMDAHGHFAFQSMIQGYANIAPSPVGPVNAIEVLLKVLKSHQEKKNIKKGEWILGWGFDDSLLEEKRYPTKFDLDKVSTEHPILIVHVSGHLAVGNSMALSLANITAETTDPAGGVIRRVKGSNEPNGVLEEMAGIGLWRMVIKEISAIQMFSYMRQAQDYYLSHGITTVQEGSASAQSFKLLQWAARLFLLKMDVVAYPNVLDMDKSITPKTVFGTYNKRLKVGGLKISLDGSPQGKTAFLTTPYHVVPEHKSADYRGYPIFSDSIAHGYIAHGFEKNLPLLIHTNGDAAIDQMLIGVEKAQAKYPNDDHRTVAIHAQNTRPDQLPRMAELGIVPSFFVAHTFYWGDWHRDSVFGPKRGAFISPLNSALDHDITFTIHNDAPVVPPDMMRLIWAGVNRITRTGKVLGPDQRVTVMDAIRAVTINAAYQHFEEDSKGSLEIGKLADLVVLSENPLDVDPLTIKDIQIMETYKEGKRLYNKD